MNKQLLFLITITILSGCTTTTEEYNASVGDVHSNELINTIQPASVNETEINGLIQMREEEKLARDVYLTLYNKWGLNIFNNIASSEQTHTNAVKELLDRYNITDPVTNNSIGAFNSTTIKELYTSLVNTGSESLINALTIGATIEDLDIKDLEELLTTTDNEDIKIVYNNLIKGSKNHLRAYVSQLRAQGSDYEPQYISQEEYDEIINTFK